jgi:hypothetical protein
MMKEVVCLHSGASTSVPLLDRSLTQLEAGETASPCRNRHRDGCGRESSINWRAPQATGFRRNLGPNVRLGHE